jgi:hypothetical protein
MADKGSQVTFIGRGIMEDKEIGDSDEPILLLPYSRSTSSTKSLTQEPPTKLQQTNPPNSCSNQLKYPP